MRGASFVLLAEVLALLLLIAALRLPAASIQ